MNNQVHIASVVGVGLLGGSLGLALKRRGLAEIVRGVGHRSSSLEKALAIGAVDETYLDGKQACRDADLVIICTPARLVCRVLDEILPQCPPRVVITDVASTKGAICAHARQHCPRPRRFVGSHPMAGSEKFGPEHARPDLYEGCTTVVEKRDDHAGDAYQAVCDLWRSLGSNVVALEPGLHDVLVARTSHVPHLLAGCLAILGASGGDVRAVVGGGFRDATRIAAGRPEVWRDICLTNREAILAGLDALAGHLAEVRELVAKGDAEGIEAFLQSAREARSKVLGE